MKSERNWIGAGVLTAIASSLCCITPVLALISGTTGMASTFSWLEPLRPYLIGFTVLVLGFAWYQKLKPRNVIDCDCDTPQKTSFLQSRKFLGIVTVFALVMMAFPYYSSLFYRDNHKEVIVVDSANIEKTLLNIKGMTCTGCEEHINHSVNELDGIIHVQSSYTEGTANIEYDKTKTSLQEIREAIDKTGYKVVNTPSN